MRNTHGFFTALGLFATILTETKPEDTTGLHLRHVQLDDRYRKRWNVHSFDDYCHLYLGERKLRNTLYRIGGYSVDMKADYFMLLKHVESYYEDSITKIKKDKPHLAGHFVIINKNGDEKVIFEQFASPYLQGGCIYSLNSKYYNIETGECYSDYSSKSFSSDEFLFLDNNLVNDRSKRGILRLIRKMVQQNYLNLQDNV